MNELSIEEKAKRYDEALKVANKYKDTHIMFPSIKDEMFSELKESEDEKIRKVLRERIIRYDPNNEILIKEEGISQKQFLAWLEKQGEHKTVVYIPKFRVGDKLVSTKNPSLTYEVLEVGHINELGNPEYKVEILTDGKAKELRNIHYIECYKVDEWAKLIDQKPAWSEEDEKNMETLINILYAGTDLAYEREINWLKSLKDRIQPKQEWSDEDESKDCEIKVVYSSM